jgi:lysophospholipase L1-like esterase
MEGTMIADRTPAASTAPEESDPVVASAKAHFANGRLSQGVRLLMEEATAAAARRDFGRAVSLFLTARSSLTEQIDPARLANTVTKTRQKLRDESMAFAAAIDAKAPTEGREVFIFSDSLGLPRLDDATLPDGGVSLTYSDKIQERSREKGPKQALRVRAHCQRYFTTDDVVERLNETRASLRSGLVFVHVGLNDCASRVFSEAERLAVPYLDQPTQDLLLKFVRNQRRPIIHKNPEYTYTPLDRFTKNLETIVKIARTSGAQHVAFATIVQPGMKSERHTPHLRWNFTRYNFAIYDVAKRMSAQVVDMDRLAWSHGLGVAMNADGQHLSPAGHDLMADAYLELVRALPGGAR